MGVRKEQVTFSNQDISTLRPSDGKRLNFFIKEHGRMFDKLDVMVKDLKEHDSTLSQLNGFALKQGEEFAHNFN